MPSMSEQRPSQEVVTVLVQNHKKFLAFLERRVGSRADAEDILQAAFVRAVEKAESIRDEGKSIAWFYQSLRNAVIDHYRKQDVQKRAQKIMSLAPDFEEEIERTVCLCMSDLIPTLPEDYSSILRRVDLEDGDIKIVAPEFGLTPNNARVRLHRARVALRKQLERVCRSCTEHGCLDCTCNRSSPR